MNAKPEIKQGMPFGDYCKIDAVNASKLLTHLDRSPEEAYYEQTHPKHDTTSLVRGHAGHAAILTPTVFASDYMAEPKFGRKNEDKIARAKFLEEHAKSVTIPQTDYDAAVSMRDSLLSIPFFAKDILGGDGMNELTVLWTDEETGLPCKARLDRVTEFHGYRLLLDLKTAQGIGDRAIRKAIMEYHYHIRLAFYLDAINCVSPSKHWRPALVWVLNHPPWTVRMTEFMDADMEEGRAAYRALLNTHAKCVKEKSYPGYAPGIEIVGIPRWGFKFTSPRE